MFRARCKPDMCGCMAVCRVTMTNMQSGREWNGLPGVGPLQSGRLSLEFELLRISGFKVSLFMSILWAVIIVHTHMVGSHQVAWSIHLSFRKKIRTPSSSSFMRLQRYHSILEVYSSLCSYYCRVTASANGGRKRVRRGGPL